MGLPSNSTVAGARRQQAHGGAQRGGLAGAVVTQKREDLARFQRERYVGDHGLRAVAGGDAGQPQHHQSAPPK